MCSIVQPRAGTGQPSSPTSSGGVCSLTPEHICERLVPAPPHWASLLYDNQLHAPALN